MPNNGKTATRKNCENLFTNLRANDILLNMTQQMIKVKARGKVNLSLNITGLSGGMHVLDSVVSSVEIFDIVNIEFNEENRISVSFVPLADDGGQGMVPEDLSAIDVENNSVVKALMFLQKYIPSLGAEVTVEKGIPLAGGLGGSSADAAAILFAAKQAFPQIFARRDIYMESVCIGSDVPFMCIGGTALMKGTGDNVLPVTSARLNLVIAKRGNGISSKAAYDMFDTIYPDGKFCPSDNSELIKELAIGDPYGVGGQLYNALTAPARKLSTDVEDILRKLSYAGAAAIFMTGSGNCCCGLFAKKDEAQRVAGNFRAEGLWAKYASTEKEGNSFI